MRRAGHKRPLSTRAIPATPSVTTLNVVAFADAPISETPVDVELLPSVQAIALVRPDETDDRDARHRASRLRFSSGSSRGYWDECETCSSARSMAW